MRDAQHPTSAARLLRGRTASGVSLFAPGSWRKELGLDPAEVKTPADLTPRPLDRIALRTRRVLHLLARHPVGGSLDWLTRELEPQPPARADLRASLSHLFQNGLAESPNRDERMPGGQWRATPLGRASADADLHRGLTPRDLMAAVRALSERAHPPALARWWPVADDRQLAPPATVAAVMVFLFGFDHPKAGAADLPARIEAGLDALVAARALITGTAPRGRNLTRCYWPATPEEPA